jgi:hypothetical protein
MFGLSKNKGAMPGILKAMAPILKMQGVDLNTVVGESAAKMSAELAKMEMQIACMITTNENGTGFTIGFYQVHEFGPMTLLYFTDIKSLDDIFSQIDTITEAFETFKNATTNTTTATEPAAENAGGSHTDTSGDAGAGTEPAGTTGPADTGTTSAPASAPATEPPAAG